MTACFRPALEMAFDEALHYLDNLNAAPVAARADLAAHFQIARRPKKSARPQHSGKQYPRFSYHPKDLRSEPAARAARFFPGGSESAIICQL